MSLIIFSSSKYNSTGNIKVAIPKILSSSAYFYNHHHTLYFFGILRKSDLFLISELAKIIKKLLLRRI